MKVYDSLAMESCKFRRAFSSQAIVHHYSRDELLRRLAHPFWLASMATVAVTQSPAYGSLSIDTFHGAGRMRGIDDLLACDLPFWNLVVRAPVPLRRGYAAARLDLDANIGHCHLGPGDRAEQHEFVEVSESPIR